MRRVKKLLPVYLLLLANCCLAQTGENTWNRIEAAILKNKELDVCAARLETLKKEALSRNDQVNYARAMYDLLRIKDRRTEDSLYFRNIAFIDSILCRKEAPGDLKLVMHVLLSHRLSDFAHRYLRYNRALYETPQLSVNYASYTNQQLDSMSVIHLEQAQQLLDRLPPLPVTSFLWLSADPLLFLFQPTVGDIITAEQINRAKERESPYANSSQETQQWLSLPPDSLVHTLQHRDVLPPVVRLYDHWLSEKMADDEAYYYIEMLLRKWLYEHSGNWAMWGSVYERYLQERSTAKQKTVRAYSVYQLCLRWNNQTSQDDYFYQTWSVEGKKANRTPADIVALYRNYDTVFQDFGSLKSTLDAIVTAILAPRIKVGMNDVQLPYQPVLAKLTYKNEPQLYYRIVPLGRTEVISKPVGDTVIRRLLSRPFIRSEQQALPLPADNDVHRCFFKMDALNPGDYALLFSGKPLDSANSPVEVMRFSVTDIAVVPAGERLYVLSRHTGRPLVGATVTATWEKNADDPKSRDIVRKYTVGKDGFITRLSQSEYDLEVCHKGDTLYEYLDEEQQMSGKELLYDKEEYDDLVEYYEDHAKVYVYTDRSIYRPGQTVYYKVVVTTNDPRTGRVILFSRSSLKGYPFHNYLKRWIQEEEPALYITDPFDRELDTIPMQPDEYGAFSGSYKIPDNAPTGDWSIVPDYIDQDWQNGHFQVEAYKKPTFELIIQKPAKTYVPGQPVVFHIQARSFSGAPLSHTHISYQLTRRLYLSGGDITVLDSSSYTDDNGLLEVTYSDSSLQNGLWPDSLIGAIYQLEATAVAATGESHEAEGKIEVSSRPVVIRIPLYEKQLVDKIPALTIKTADVNGLPLDKRLRVRVYKVLEEADSGKEKDRFEADQWLYSKQELREWFPALQFAAVDSGAKQELVYETYIQTGGFEKLVLPDTLSAGKYTIKVVCEESGRVTGEGSVVFSFFKTAMKMPAATYPVMLNLPVNYAGHGSTVPIYAGVNADSMFSVVHISYYVVKKGRDELVSSYLPVPATAGVTRLLWKVPSNLADKAVINLFSIRHNQIYEQEKTLWISNDRETPQIVLEQYRTVLEPGEKTVFKVAIKAAGKDIPAELMSVLYDASLDRLEKHSWEPPRLTTTFGNIYSRHEPLSDGITGTSDDLQWIVMPDTGIRPIWWLPASELPENSYRQTSNPVQYLQGRVPGLSMNGQDELVVIGYSTTKRLMTGYVTSVTSKQLSIKGFIESKSIDHPLVVLDGVVYAGELTTLDTIGITNGLYLQGAEATAIYGARASKGVFVFSTRGEIVLPQPPRPVERVRNDFRETAFFYPAVHADKEGNYQLSFTMPDAVTEWNWKMLAHTRDARFATAVHSIQTRLPLMVEPAVPRFLYQGDELRLPVRISNLDSLPAAGTVTCTIIDVATGNDISGELLQQVADSFQLPAARDSTVSFLLKIPRNQLSSLRITVKATTSRFADAEEHTVPIMANSLMVQQNIPVALSGRGKQTVKLPDLPPAHLPVGIGLSVEPSPHMALLEAWTYLAAYPFDCAEQTFNKMLANLVALDRMRHDTALQESYSSNKMLPDTALDVDGTLTAASITPWQSLEQHAGKQHRMLMTLLDTALAKASIDQYMNRLYKLQTADGGMVWFEGGDASAYISYYILASFGKLPAAMRPATDQYRSFVKALAMYADKQFIEEPALFYCYARQYWLAGLPVSDNLADTVRRYLAHQWKLVKRGDLYQQALLCIASLQWTKPGDEPYGLALRQLDDIRQLAIEDPVHGLRWKALAEPANGYTTAEEIMALLYEAFTLAGKQKELLPGMEQWLLTTRNANNWHSTKSTAAVIGLLNSSGQSFADDSQVISANMGERLLKVSADPLSGSSYAFIPSLYLPASLTVQKTGDQDCWANLQIACLVPFEQLQAVENGVRIVKKILRHDMAAGRWVPASGTLKTGDTVRVQLSINTSQRLQYLHIDDKRAATLEPVEAQSGYYYSHSVGFYRAISDTGCSLFIDNMEPGAWIIEYDRKVSLEGRFTDGPVQLQCLYQPAISAVCPGSRLFVGKE